MLNLSVPLYLASNSPRRKKMLHSLGIDFHHISIDHEEIINKNHSPLKNVKRLAGEKCKKAVSKIKDGIVISADTIVVLNNKIIGKPINENDAKNILKNLSGKTHIVYTGFAICDAKSKKNIIDFEKTKVTFYNLSDKQIEDYVNTGSPMDKAGAYGIQDDFGALFVKKIDGCYNNVMGFPIAKIFRALEKLN
ncbi:MAG: septum formation protein Maf [Ignavibacteriae bacterium]|nr:septum formation protein Maf [Ignavibacteriota bacterium]